MSILTWEQAVQWLRQQPDQEQLVRACYYDDPLIEAAKRFADSEEWKAVQTFLPRRPRQALDLGAGRGISSYALARDGWQVTAVEPDPSPLVGTGAIRQLAKESGLPIRVVEKFGELLPFGNSAFDLVYARQVLHHARNLPLLCQEVARVIKPCGRFIATREHVISKTEDLHEFLDSHPLHKFYGGENAYLLSEYVVAMCENGFRILKVLGPFDSVINYFPTTYDEWRAKCIQPLPRIIRNTVALPLVSKRHLLGRWVLSHLAARLSNSADTPGRLYSFIAERPQA